MSQFSIPCTVYRGGTSRGLFFHRWNLPDDVEKQRKIFLEGIDAYNLSQVNGLGSGTSYTSKVAVISPSSVEGADVDYTFYQVGIGKEEVDDIGTCGNLMAGVGAFAVDEGLINTDTASDTVNVSIFSTNIKKFIRVKVPVENKVAKVNGNYLMPGLVKPGSKYEVDIFKPGGGVTGKTMPLGKRYSISTSQQTYDITLIDVINPIVFVHGSKLGVKGTQLISELASQNQLLQELEYIRTETAIAAGMARERNKVSSAIPKIVLVFESQDYKTSTGELIKKENVDIVAKMVSMERFHRTFAVSGLYSLAASSLLQETIPNYYISKDKSNKQKEIIRIGHPEGVIEVRVSLTRDQEEVASVGLDRTVRRIIKGNLFIPDS